MSGKYVGYVNENHRTLIAERLYLPTDWANDPIRRIECGVPEDVIFKTKGELALEMLLDAEGRKFPFAWVGMDCFYRQQPWLLENIDEKGITYIADIPCNTRVWLDLPKTDIPEKKEIVASIPCENA
ncbi:MAG: transposase [ANME-2 cluster archaeon]|nr:transposase [ANME-2 cluster archaeon]